MFRGNMQVGVYVTAWQKTIRVFRLHAGVLEGEVDGSLGLGESGVLDRQVS